MPKKKTEEEIVETANSEATEETAAATEEVPVEVQADTEANAETPTETDETKVEAQAETEDSAVEAKADEEDKSKKSGGKKKAEATAAAEETSIVDSIFETVAGAIETVSEAVVAGVSTVVSAVTGSTDEEPTEKKKSHRAERIGIVASDKMTKTVTVRVDRQVKHPIYRKYIKRRKKFMAHDEMGASIGDKVRIIETRPLSAKKRWRVVEIIQKAEK